MGTEQREHLDDHALWDVALGEDVGPSPREHLAACPTCQDAVEERRHVADLVTDPPPADLRLRPPGRVLDAVRAELGLDAPVTGRSAPRPSVVPAQRAAPPSPGRRRTAAVLLAAAGLVLAGGTVGVVLGQLLGGGPADGGTVLARADLDAVDGGARAGTVVLHERDGVRFVDVDLDADASTGPAGEQGAGPSYEEVWLLDPDARPILSLGVLGDGRGSFAVPVGLAERGLVVDVSSEPLDGSPDHSGDSLVRASLDG